MLLPPLEVLLWASGIAVFLGIVMVCCSCGWYKYGELHVSATAKLLTAGYIVVELFDCLQDWSAYFTTKREGDLNFANDPGKLLEWSIVAAAAFSTIAFCVELCARCYMRSTEKHDRFYKCVPVLVRRHNRPLLC